MAVLCASCLFVLFAIAGAAIDYNRALSAEVELQAALDSAILAAANADPANYQNAFDDAFAASIAMSGADLGGANASAGSTQDVGGGLLKNTASGCLATHFIKAFGINCLDVDAETFAEKDAPSDVPPATHTALPSNPCVFFTDPRNRGLEVENNAEFIADCTIHLWTSGNAIKVHSGGVADLGGFCARGSVSNNGSLTPAVSTSGCSIVIDPFAGLQNPAKGACVRQATTVNAGQTVTFDPGLNCGNVRVRAGGTLILAPGVHTFDNPFTIDQGGRMEGDNVLVVLKERTDYTVNGELDLKGVRDADDPYRGFVIFLEDHSGNSNELTIGQQADFDTDGVIYLPNTKFWMYSTVNDFSTRSILVTDRIKMSSGSKFYAKITEESETPFPTAFTDGSGNDEYDVTTTEPVVETSLRLSYDKSGQP